MHKFHELAKREGEKTSLEILLSSSSLLIIFKDIRIISNSLKAGIESKKLVEAFSRQVTLDFNVGASKLKVP